MVLTPRAEDLIEPVAAVLTQIRETIATPKAFEPGQSERNIRVMISNYTSEVLLSPTLPLPVELVAGGEGSPDPFEDVLGLGGSGGSGRSGRAGGVEPGVGPIYIADKGRDLADRWGRGGIGKL